VLVLTSSASDEDHADLGLARPYAMSVLHAATIARRGVPIPSAMDELADNGGHRLACDCTALRASQTSRSIVQITLAVASDQRHVMKTYACAGASYGIHDMTVNVTRLTHPPCTPATSADAGDVLVTLRGPLAPVFAQVDERLDVQERYGQAAYVPGASGEDGLALTRLRGLSAGRAGKRDCYRLGHAPRASRLHAAYLYNARAMNDGEQAAHLIQQTRGKRLTYRESVRGKTV
jgi:hypothetical protein